MNRIDTSNWGEFRIGNLFDIHPTKAYKLTNSSLFEEDGVNPVVVNSSFNNGIGGYTNKPITEQGNIITFSDTTTATAMFYQAKPFVGYAHIQGMYPIGEYKDKWNEKSLLFFLSVFRNRAISSNFDYVNKFTREFAKKMMVKLPTDKHGDPDFSYMEIYMKNREIIACDSLTKLQSTKQCSAATIGTVNFADFRIEDLFIPLSISKKLSKSNLENNGFTPVHSSETLNNGIAGYTNMKAEFVVNKDNPLYFVFGDHTKSMHIADYSFCVMDNVKVLKPKINNVLFLLFVATQWSKAIPNLGYARHWNVAKNTLIKLPVTSDMKPDIAYIETYMQKLQLKTNKTLTYLQNVL